MSELDDLLKTLEGLPTGAEEKREWVDERSERLGELMARAAGEITEFAATAYALTLVAAGDISALDGIEKIWYTFVTEVVGEYTAGMYLTGNLSAFVGVPGEGPPPEAAAQWASVVNENAVAYQAAATNRIVGASTDMWQDVRDKVTSNIQDGMSVEQTKSAIEEVTGYSEFRADAIGRTEVQGAYAGGEMAGARALGEFGPTEKSWLSATDSRTRKTHLRADGQTVPIDEPFIIGGERMDRPLDPSASAAEVVNCRCVVQLLYPGDRRPDGSTVGDEEPNAGQEATEEREFTQPTSQPVTQPVATDGPLPADMAARSDFPVTQDRAEFAVRAKETRAGLDSSDVVVFKRVESLNPNGSVFNGGFQTDKGLAQIMKTRGVDGGPNVGSRSKINDMVASGQPEIFRGTGVKEATTSFIEGEYASGTGIYGNGFYGSNKVRTAQQYQQGGDMIRMALNPGSKVIDFDELEELWDDFGGLRMQGSSELAARDMGRFAANLGYDAIRKSRGAARVGGVSNEKYWVILNRQAVTVEDTVLDSARVNNLLFDDDVALGYTRDRLESAWGKDFVNDRLGPDQV